MMYQLPCIVVSDFDVSDWVESQTEQSIDPITLQSAEIRSLSWRLFWVPAICMLLTRSRRAPTTQSKTQHTTGITPKGALHKRRLHSTIAERTQSL